MGMAMRVMFWFSWMSLMTLGSEVRGQALDEITVITFTKQTRGFIDEVIISRDSVRAYSENHRSPESLHHYATDIDTDRWAELIHALRNVPLHQIDGLQSPTTNRAHDGAMHSSIVITFEDGSTVSHSFDDENPHPDLQPLMEAINAFRLSAPKHR